MPKKQQPTKKKNQHFCSFNVLLLWSQSIQLHKLLIWFFFYFSVFLPLASLAKNGSTHWTSFMCRLFSQFHRFFIGLLVNYVIFRLSFYFVYIYTFVIRVSFERISFRKWFLVYSSASNWYMHGTHCVGLFWSFVFMVSVCFCSFPWWNRFVFFLSVCLPSQFDSVSFLVSTDVKSTLISVLVVCAQFFFSFRL